MRIACLALMLVVGCAAAPERPAKVVEERAFAGPAARGDALLRRAMIEGHSRARSAVGLGPLAWSDALAADAALYAAELARAHRFEHSPLPRGNPPQGENLWTGTRDAYRYDEMVGHWVGEKIYYRPNPTPDFSSTGRWGDVAHYTQIVWRGTRTVGCALASDARSDFLVCRYTPAGNVVGQRAY